MNTRCTRTCPKPVVPPSHRLLTDALLQLNRRRGKKRKCCRGEGEGFGGREGRPTKLSNLPAKIAASCSKEELPAQSLWMLESESTSEFRDRDGTHMLSGDSGGTFGRGGGFCEGIGKDM